MDEPEQARAYAQADFAAPHERFVSLFGEAFPGERLVGAAVIDLGCGPADVTMRFARGYPGCRITGVDAGPNMLALGRRAIADAGLSSRITLVRGHLPAYPLAAAVYDGVICNSLLHHLADPMVLWRAIGHCAKPSAWVLDLLRPVDAAAVNGLVEEHTRGEPDVLRQDFRNSLLASYRAEEVRAQIDAAGLSGLAVRVVSDRHWIAVGRVL